MCAHGDRHDPIDRCERCLTKAAAAIPARATFPAERKAEIAWSMTIECAFCSWLPFATRLANLLFLPVRTFTLETSSHGAVLLGFPTVAAVAMVVMA